MQNEDFYDEDNNAYAIIAVDFENYSDSAKKIKDCDIYWIFFSRVYNEVLKMPMNWNWPKASNGEVQNRKSMRLTAP